MAVQTMFSKEEEQGEMKETCEKCRWAHEECGHRTCRLECRRRAPQVGTETLRDLLTGTEHTRTIAYWPIVSASDFCGEYEPPASGEKSWPDTFELAR